jgi:hypothetical protein
MQVNAARSVPGGRWQSLREEPAKHTECGNVKLFFIGVSIGSIATGVEAAASPGMCAVP